MSVSRNFVMPLDPAHKLRQAPLLEVGITVPEILSDQVDALVAACDRADCPTTRREVIAAVLLAAPADPSTLRRYLRAYRSAPADASPGYPLTWSAHDESEVAVPLCRTPTRRIGLSVPGPLSARLDALLAGVRRTGEDTTRQELVAMLILASIPGDDLAATVQQYRAATIADAQVAGADDSSFTDPRAQPRGRRPRALTIDPADVGQQPRPAGRRPVSRRHPRR